MKRFLLFAYLSLPLGAHDLITTKITWSREISRLVLDKCVSCHRDGGSAFSLATYQDARPWAKAIKEEVLERRMPPFGAVKGFADLLNDQALTQEQMALISAWVEGGAPEGDAALLPKDINRNAQSGIPHTGPEFQLTSGKELAQQMTVAGIRPKSLPEEASVKVIAQAPDGSVTPLLWIYQYRAKFAQSYFFREPLILPAGTRIITYPELRTPVVLLPAAKPVHAAARASR